jgi:hypothetical protein
VNSITSGYVTTATDDIIVADTSGGALEVDLAACASNAGKIYTIARNTSAGTNAVTIDPNGSELIDGTSTSNTEIDASGDSLTIACDGTEWIIIGSEID